MFQSPFMPAGQPFGRSNPYESNFALQNKQLNPMPQQDGQPPPISRFMNYVADYGGCGFWRIIWPEYLLNASGKCMVHTSTCMTVDPQHYRNAEAIKVQRQASPDQRKFVKYLKEISSQAGFRLIYEIDDLAFREDIPDYNKYKFAFTDDEIREGIQEIMELCDEMTVTCKFMKDYYSSKLDNAKITVIPNCVPKFWMGNFYNRDKIERDYERCKRKPRVIWSGSGAHVDVDNRVKGKDDFHHVNDVIRKTIKDYQWVFLGAIPRDLVDLVQKGKIEYHPWCELFDYPEKVYTLNGNMMIAPLIDNNFNKSKSDLKYLESSCYGLPIACQDICTYENAPIKFKTGDEMIDQINTVLKDERRFIQESVKARNFAESRFLEKPENIGKFYESYKFPYGSPKRKYLNTIKENKGFTLTSA
jgi:glycosyltransferase involved in cell wall biosynthesis